MIVSCVNCESKYSVNDDKVKNKRFGFTCPNCGQNVEIDNRAVKAASKMRPEHFPADDEFSGISDNNEEKPGPDLVLDDNIDDFDFPDTGEKDPGPVYNEPGLPASASADENEIDLPDLDLMGEEPEKAETADDFLDIDSDTAAEEISGEEDYSEKEELNSDDINPENFEDMDILEELDGNIVEKTEDEMPEKIYPLENGDDLSEKQNTGGGAEDSDEKAFSEDISRDIDDLMNSDEIKSSGIFSQKSENEEEDESITIDLDSLDIQLDDDEKVGHGIQVEELSDSIEPYESENLEISDMDLDLPDMVKEVSEATDDDEDITLDLDALDLTLDEVEELNQGEPVDETDDRLSLADAGLIADELMEEKPGTETGHEVEDIKLNVNEVVIDDIDADMGTESEEPDIETETLDDIDSFEGYEPDIQMDEVTDENVGIGDDIHGRKDFKEHEKEIASLDIDIRDTVPKGMISFSIDYTLKCSRLRAFLRLIGLYMLGLIPHFIVLFIYLLLSNILSMLNRLIILFSGKHEEDFTLIQENTNRYLLAFIACAGDVAEDMPEFAGRKDLDYQLQYEATYPVTNSRILAFLRLTVIGILIAALPHLIILSVLMICCIPVNLVGLIAVIILGKWPKILFEFMKTTLKYAAEVMSYATGVVDRYPSFKIW